jgi:hypothetical protein
LYEPFAKNDQMRDVIAERDTVDRQRHQEVSRLVALRSCCTQSGEHLGRATSCTCGLAGDVGFLGQRAGENWKIAEANDGRRLDETLRAMGAAQETRAITTGRTASNDQLEEGLMSSAQRAHRAERSNETHDPN